MKTLGDLDNFKAILSRHGNHFADADTLCFFNGKLNACKDVKEGVLLLHSVKGFWDGAKREYRVTLFRLLDNGGIDHEDLESFSTLNSARKFYNQTK